MSKTAVIHIRVAPKVKKDAEDLFYGLGISVAEAVNIFFHKAIMEGGIPFDIRKNVDNAETLASREEEKDMLDQPKRIYSAQEETFEEYAATSPRQEIQGKELYTAAPQGKQDERVQ